MKTSYILGISALALATAFTSCNKYGATDTYRANQVGVTQEVATGTVTYVRQVQIKTNNASTGTALGAVAGGLTGAMFGGGNAKYATAAGGAILGGLAGNQIEKGINDTEGLQINVKLDNSNKTINITQEKDKRNPIWVGQRVQVLMGGNGSRVIAL